MLRTTYLFFCSALLVAMPAIGLHGAETKPPGSSSPALEDAAAKLASQQFDEAARRFTAIASDTTQPPYLRGYAGLGVSQTAIQKGDTNAAIQNWRKVVGDLDLPAWQRELASRRIAETERAIKGLPGRDPVLYQVPLPSLPQPGKVFHVAPNGNDSGDGSAEHPFASLSKARDAVRAWKNGHGGTLPGGGVEVEIAGGIYKTREPLRLAAEDSGTSNAPVVYRAKRGTQVVLAAGSQVTGWKQIADTAVSAKLQPAVRDLVLVSDLKASGITNFGDPTDLKARPELFANGVPQTLARWPNTGFVKTGEILGKDTFKVWGSISGCKDGKFRFLEDRAKSWVDEPDVRLYGYWFWDWYEEYQKVASINSAEGSFTLAKPYSTYGYRKDQRYFAVNILRELDSPGEWYLDRNTGQLYWFPPADLNPAKAEVVMSVASEPFIEIENAEHIVILGLTLQEGRTDGIRIKGGANCLVAGCELRRLGGDGIIIDGGLHHGVFGCAMTVLGCGGMRVAGGDRAKLIAGNHFVENCLVSDIARIKRTYAPAVHLDGCGNRIAHNLFERIPSSAMRIEGNDHVIELNRVRNVVQESDDQGGIDMFGNPLYRGVMIRWNRWSDIIGGTECGAAGIRLDDMISGIVLYGNVFERCGAVQFGAVQIHGGKDNYVDGNVFIDCHAGFSFSRWDEPRWLKSIEPFLAQASAEPYKTRYPDIARIKTEPNVNVISRNLLFGCKNIFLRDGGVQKSLLMQVREGPAPDWVLQPTATAGVEVKLFEPIPVLEIGPYPHPWKAAWNGN